MGVYTFDDGSDESLLSRLAADYLDLLAPLDGRNGSQPGERGPYLKTLRQLPIDPSEELILAKSAIDYLGPLPGAYVVIGGGESFAAAPDLIKWEQTVRIYLASGSPGRLVHGRLRDSAQKPGQDPGIFTMWQHVIEYLHGAALSHGPIHVEDHAPVYSSETMSMWVIVTRVKIQQDIDASRDAPLVDGVEATHARTESEPIAKQRREF